MKQLNVKPTLQMIKEAISSSNIKSEIKYSLSEKTKIYSEILTHQSISPKTVLFESNYGNQLSGDLLYLFKSLKRDIRFRKFKWIWVYNTDFADGIDEIFKSNDIEFVNKNSLKYLEYLATAEYYFNDTEAPVFYLKREGQKYITIGESNPFFYVGYDAPYDDKNPYPVRNRLRSYLMSDFILSDNPKSTEILLRAYKLSGLFEGKILEASLPRFDSVHYKENLVSQLHGIYDSKKETLVWNISTFSMDPVAIERFTHELEYLIQKLGVVYNIYLLIPENLKEYLLENEKYVDHIVPDTVDIMSVLAMTDVLLSDYSSLSLDYLKMNNNLYYYSLEDVDITYSYLRKEQIDEYSVDTIYDFIHRKLQKKENTVVNKQWNSSLFIEMIFFANAQNSLHVVEIENNKKTLLFYAGYLKNNFITNRFFNVLKEIDFDQYDISVLIPSNDLTVESYENLRKISSKIRPIFYEGYAIFSGQERLQDSIIRKKGIIQSDISNYPKKAYRREANRVFSNAHFTAAIDFQGDNFYWSRYIAESNSLYKILLQQYDLEYQWNKALKNNYVNKKLSLYGMMTYYQFYDQIINIYQRHEKNLQFIKDYVAEEYVTYYKTSDKEPILDFPFYDGINNVISNQTKCVQELIINNVKELTVIPNLQNMNLTQTITIHPSDQIITLNKIYLDGIEYYKVMVNSIYRGWIINPQELSENVLIISQNHQCNYDTKIIKNRKIFKNASDPVDTSLYVGMSKELSGVIVRVTEEILTSDGIRCHIFINDEELGYISKDALSIINPFNAQVLLNYKLKNKAIRSRSLETEELNVLGVLNKKEKAILYTQPIGSINSEVSEIKNYNLADRPLKILKLVTNKFAQSYLILDDFGQSAWIAKEDITLL